MSSEKTAESLEKAPERQSSIETGLRNPSSSPQCAQSKRNRISNFLPPRRFWDNLSKIHLTPLALQEFDRRTAPILSHSLSKVASGKVTSTNNLDRFARLGGPDLSFLRGFSESFTSTSDRKSKMAHSGGQLSTSRKKSTPRKKPASRKKSAPRKKLTLRKKPMPLKKSTPPKKLSTYDKNFEQHLADWGIHNVYKHDEEAANSAEIKQKLMQRRTSLSPSHFTQADFARFKMLNGEATGEQEVVQKILPILLGNKVHPSANGKELNNLSPLTDGSIVTCRPDYYEGARPSDMKVPVRLILDKSIVPSKNKSRPCLPNFFIELKGPLGTKDVLLRQACYDAAIGARTMYLMHGYVDADAVPDGHAYAIAATYDGGVGGDSLKLYVTHLSASGDSDRRLEYCMTQLRSFSLTDSEESFREGVSALRNARDWASEWRQEAINAANEEVG